MDDLWRIVAGTPWWVWVLFAYLLWRGIRALKPATGPLWRFAIIPAVFLLWGLYDLVLTIGLSGLSGGAYLLALAVGCGLGWLVAAPVTVQVDRSKGLVTVPGGPLTLVLILVIFGLKYTLGAWQGVQPGVTVQAWFIMVDAGVSGLVSGMFIGRFAHLWRKMRLSQDEPLAGSAP